MLEANVIKYIKKSDGGVTKSAHPNVFNGIRYGRVTFCEEKDTQQFCWLGVCHKRTWPEKGNEMKRTEKERGVCV